jgi:hypothetical protein
MTNGNPTYAPTQSTTRVESTEFTRDMLHVDKEYYEFTRNQIMTDLADQKPSGHFSVAIGLVGIGCSALFAWYALPKVASEVRPGADAVLVWLAVGAFVLALGFYCFHRARKSDIHKKATAICKQLDMYASYTPPPDPHPPKHRIRNWLANKVRGEESSG